MADTPPPTEDSVKNKTEFSALLRLGEVRWILFTALCIAVVLIAFYSVPVSAAVGGLFILVLAAIWGARRPVSPGVKLKAGRELRRMWPGTGMKLTVDALPDPCFVADGRGITRYVNTQAMTVYQGVKPGDPLSLSLRIPSLLEAFDRVKNTGNSERISWTEKVPTELWFEANIAPIYMPGATGNEIKKDVPDFILVVIQDQTENRRLERMRTDFVANASHELRTPLASLTGFVETLQGPAREDPVARDKFLSIMLEQSGRMRRLIDDILSLSRIELKAHVLPTNIVDLSDIVRHTADALAPLAKDMEMEIRLSLPSDPVNIAGDRDELIQVTENLVENALKYGSTGKAVDVGLEVVSEGDGRSQWQLSVKDYGEGIPIEHLPRLTERFYRVDVESSRALKGTGLGLAIVKHILTRHRARLDVDSELCKGSTFKVTFQNAESA